MMIENYHRDNVDYRLIEGRGASSDELEQVRSLYAHLSQAQPTAEQILRTANATSGELILAIESTSGIVVGVVVITIIDILAKRKALINDVVVKPEHRRRGVGQKILSAAICCAERKGCAYVELTCSQHRYAAMAMYQARGFVKRETAVFRLQTASDL